jgi:protein-tyrosine phosphatase
MYAMHKVTPYLYISNYRSASDVSQLSSHKITHIVNLTAEYPNVFPNSYTYLHIPARDALHERLGPHFDRITTFVTNAQIQDNGVTLIHCAEGVSRSATGVLAVLMLKESMKLADAMRLLRGAKGDVEPNRAFLRELRGLEKRLFGEFCTDRLTMLDDVRPPAGEGEWREELAVVLACAAMEGSDGNDDTDSGITKRERVDRGNACVVQAMKGAHRDDKTINEKLTEFMTCGLESYGGRNEKDVRARKALREMVENLIGRVFDSSEELRRALKQVSETEEWLDLVIDVPVAQGWLQEAIN